MGKTRFLYVTYIRTTPEKLWQALTEAEFTRQYWCATWQECEWKVGASWKIFAPDGRVADSGQILEIDRPKKLVLTWKNFLFAEAEAEGFSQLTYELEQLDETVKLTVIHEIDKDHSKLIQSTSSGWPAILSSLKSLLETGQPLEQTRRWPEGI